MPSKYADYAGSGVPIWGIVAKESALAEKKLAYRSSHDADDIARVVEELVPWAGHVSAGVSVTGGQPYARGGIRQRATRRVMAVYNRAKPHLPRWAINLAVRAGRSVGRDAGIRRGRADTPRTRT